MSDALVLLALAIAVAVIRWVRPAPYDPQLSEKWKGGPDGRTNHPDV